MKKVYEVSLKFNGNYKVAHALKISSSHNSFQLLFEAWKMDQIELQKPFKIILLNNANIVKGIYEVSSGGITGTLVDLRIIFAVLLKSISTLVPKLIEEQKV